MLRILFLLLFSSPLFAADPSIRLPQSPSVPTPMPLPAKPVSKLAADEWYVVDSDVPVIVLASPEGVVSVGEDAGPVKLRGKFADGTGRTETRTYAGKHVFTLEAVTTGKIELLIVPVGGAAKDVIRRTIEVTGARPPPIDDDVKPMPDPKPKPEPYAGKFRMVVIEETDMAASNRAAFFADKDLLAYLKTKLSGKVRVADQDVKDETGVPPKDLVPYLNRAKGKALPQVFLVTDGGTVLMEGDLPKTPAELLATIKKAVGE